MISSLIQIFTLTLRYTRVYSEKYKRQLKCLVFDNGSFVQDDTLWKSFKHCLQWLSIAYNDYLSDFVELLAKDDTVTINQGNLRILAIEIYKISNDLSPLLWKTLWLKYASLTTLDQLQKLKKTMETRYVWKNQNSISQLSKPFLKGSNPSHI